MSLSFHLFLPQMRMTHTAIVERALAAEDARFDGIAFMDHLAPPLATQHEMWEAMSTASWVLARTTRLHVGHLVLCDAFRHPSVLARQATSLDHASGGRFELGIGWGSVPAELMAFGIEPTEARDRVDRLGESLEVMQALWTGEVVSYAGRYLHLDGAQQRPVPTRAIPITIGGVGPRTIELVRAHADWWNVPVHQLHRLDELRDRVGTARVSIQVMVGLVADEASRDETMATARRRFGGLQLGESLLVGTEPELADHFRGLVARGVERVYVWFADFAPPETLRRFADVIASVGGADRTSHDEPPLPRG
jgi:alkanesulfonate monooxygenase SsuD/methylene tetrahydromethanopterin reductase-like flavin-dependent oxidoreductase (luciferase family)